jgi:hypothetical protein
LVIVGFPPPINPTVTGFAQPLILRVRPATPLGLINGITKKNPDCPAGIITDGNELKPIFCETKVCQTVK